MKHIARRTALGLAALGVLGAIVAYGAVWRASRILDRLFREWATDVIAQESGGVYQLSVSEVRLNWGLRRVGVDTITLATRRGVNAQRPQALPGVRLVLRDCTITGLHVFALIRRGGLIANALTCRDGSLAVEVPRGTRGEAPAKGKGAFGKRDAFLVAQQAVRLPPYAPLLRIGYVVFPALALDVRLPGSAGSETRLELERLQWNMRDVVIDPADTMAATRPLFSRRITLAANAFVTHPDRETVMRVGGLYTSLTDSTVEIRDVLFGPSVTGAAARQARPFRHDLIRLAAGSIIAQGVDIGAFIVGKGVWARRVDVDSFRLDVTSDKRIEAGPDETHRTPQQWVADLDETLSLDSLVVSHSQVVYREYAEGRERPGVLTFGRVRATAVNVSHVVGRHTSGDPMTLWAHAYLQNSGPLDVKVVVPMDAPRFDMSVRGTLGPMPAEALNAFMEETGAIRIEHGQVAGVAFDLTVRNGAAQGTVTPRFSDLRVSVTQAGSSGILGGGGILGKAARGLVSFAAKRALQSDNPGGQGEPLRVGTIDRAFSRDDGLIGFLWEGVRDGLLGVVRR